MAVIQNQSAHAWQSLPDAVSPSLKRLGTLLNNDPQWQAYINTEAIQTDITIGVQSTQSDNAILVTVSPNAKTNVSTGSPSKADFTLVAQPGHWESFFAANPKAPYTSFVGIQVSYTSNFAVLLSSTCINNCFNKIRE